MNDYKTVFVFLLAVSTAGWLGQNALWTNKCNKTDQTAQSPDLWNGHAKKSGTRFGSTEVWQADLSSSQGCTGCH